MKILLNKKIATAMGLVAGLMASGDLLAKVSPEQAARLGAELTPVGAEKAGNAAGTIPAWPAIIETARMNYQAGEHHPDPFANELPLFEITAANSSQYADNLTEGQLELLKLYPETFKMKVFPSHRTSVLPNRINDKTKECATQAEFNNGAVENARSCIPFPIPQSGEEVVWNHLLRYQGVYRETAPDAAVPTASGRYTLSGSEHRFYSPYYDPQAKAGNILSKWLPSQVAPARYAGDTFLFIDSLNPKAEPRKSWRYFVGQRRVRKAPIFAYDTPIPISQGLATVDSFDMFFGATDRYNWELKGKREVYIPYNNYQLGSNEVEYKDMLQAGHLNAELPRYELHRVWVVEAKLKEDEKHIYPRRVLYFDEDSWTVHLHDMYDKENKLWRTAHRYTKHDWEANVTELSAEVHHDLLSRRYYAHGMMNEKRKSADYGKPVPPKSYFTPATVRKVGIR